MSMTEWAENEVKIACKKENPGWNGEDFDYGCGCYQSALKAYRSLMEDGHSGASFAITRNILERLLNERPLTPIEDTEDVWYEIKGFSDKSDETDYQCNRLHSLLKTVNKNGSVSYSDNSRYVGIDEKGHGYSSGLVSKIVNEMFPITMPYYPENGRYKVYTESFVAKGFEGDNGDYNTEVVLYCITPKGERVEINRYYGEKDGNMVEITKEEYEKRENARMSMTTT